MASPCASTCSRSTPPRFQVQAKMDAWPRLRACPCWIWFFKIIVTHRNRAREKTNHTSTTPHPGSPTWPSTTSVRFTRGIASDFVWLDDAAEGANLSGVSLPCTVPCTASMPFDAALAQPVLALLLSVTEPEAAAAEAEGER